MLSNKHKQGFMMDKFYGSSGLYQHHSRISLSPVSTHIL